MEDKQLVTPKVDRESLAEGSREIARSLWQGKLTTNEQRAVNHICKMYNLDPLQRQILVLGGNMYITKSGILNIAHNDANPPAGIEVVPATKQEREDSNVPVGSHYWKAIVWKKGMEKPFIEFGEANEKNVNLHNKDWRVISDMAKTRAVNRALRNAYRIGFTSVEEMGLSEPPPIVEQNEKDTESCELHESETVPPENDALISDAQRRRLYAISKQVGRTEEEIKAYLRDMYGISSSKEIRRSQYDNIVNWIELKQEPVFKSDNIGNNGLPF